jgi:predicted anti-sigma-YlaC factor YlaD
MVSCEYVLNNLSNFIDYEIDGSQRAEIEDHLRMCRRCSVLHDSLRKVLIIASDEQTFEVPTGFSERLHVFLNKTL